MSAWLSPLKGGPMCSAAARTHRPQQTCGAVYLDLDLDLAIGAPHAAQPFTLSVLRNPPRFRSGSPAQPQLLIASFPVDVPLP
ncbi:hypothetical protein ACU686_09535 [Yinghuangia aomiensis]